MLCSNNLAVISFAMPQAHWSVVFSNSLCFEIHYSAIESYVVSGCC
jgi:hypothetical protein